MNNNIVTKLRKILVSTTKTKKHSAYQKLPKNLEDIVGDISENLNPKFEDERLEYILSKINLKNKDVLDIGCNTGYFSIESYNHGAKSVDGYDGGKEHYEFAKLAVEALGIQERVKIKGEYYLFNQSRTKYDVTFLLNILHHIGDEFDDKSLSINSAKTKIITVLNSMSAVSKVLIFQMGFNWKGNIKTCLYEKGTKQEMISYIEAGIKDYWDVISVGVPIRRGRKIIYADLDKNNIQRDDSLGEFLNRPIFILQSKKRNEKQH